MYSKTLSSPIDQMIYVSFNQNASCFALGTEKGFKVFDSFNFGRDVHERVMDGGIGIVELYYRTNYIALVGGGKHPKYPKTKVVLWDDFNTKIVAEFKFTSSIKNVKLKRDKIIIICKKKLFMFSLLTYDNLLNIDTNDNPQGLISVNLDPANTVIAYLTNTDTIENAAIKIHLFEKGKDVLISPAYESAISYFALNYDGSLIAIASDKGTIIRIYRTVDGMFLQEFKRGKEKAEISYICFDQQCKLMAATSDRGTIHIWSMGSCIKKSKETPVVETADNTGLNHTQGRENNEEDSFPKNKNSILSSLPGIGEYFKSEWSFAQVRLDNQKSICAFGPDNTIIAITAEGRYYQAQIDMKKGGNCKILKEENLVNCQSNNSNNTNSNVNTNNTTNENDNNEETLP